MLPPVLVPRYSEFPAGHSSPPSMPPFQQVPEPTMPHNVTYPNNFRQGPHSPASSGPGSPYGVPGKTLECFLKHKDKEFTISIAYIFMNIHATKATPTMNNYINTLSCWYIEQRSFLSGRGQKYLNVALVLQDE